MKPFRFSLDVLRSVRQHKEDTVRERYAATLRTCEEAAARVQATSAELTACWATLRDKLATGVTGANLLKARAWCNVLELRLKERAAALEKARHDVDSAWQELMLATRERETLDRFYEKRRRAYTLDFQREEQRILDELAIQLAQSPFPLRSPTATNASAL